MNLRLLGLALTGAGIASAAAVLLPMPALAASGFVALEGSDATAYHHDAQYTPQLFHYLQGSSTKSVLIYNPAGAIDLTGITGGVATTDVISLTGVTLSDYSALYIESPGGCCAADNTVLNGFGTEVTNFVAAGGNLSIENYVGGTYDGVVPGGNAPLGDIQGSGAVTGGVGSGSSCTDGETVTPLGVARGFSQPPVDGCWSHQAYSNSYFGSLGYVNLIASSKTDFTFADGTNDGSSFLAFGGTLGAPISAAPEPSAWALTIVGVFGVGLAFRRARSKSALALA